MMVKFATLLRENAEQIAWLECALVGKESRVAAFEANEVAECFVCMFFLSPLLLTWIY